MAYPWLALLCELFLFHAGLPYTTELCSTLQTRKCSRPDIWPQMETQTPPTCPGPGYRKRHCSHTTATCECPRQEERKGLPCQFTKSGTSVWVSVSSIFLQTCLCVSHLSTSTSTSIWLHFVPFLRGIPLFDSLDNCSWCTYRDTFAPVLSVRHTARETGLRDRRAIRPPPK